MTAHTNAPRRNALNWLSGVAACVLVCTLCLLTLPAAKAADKADVASTKLIQQAKQKSYEPLDLSLFRDSIHHWQMKDGRGRNDQRLEPNQIVHIAENLLRYQNKDGGWPTNLDWLALIDVQEIRSIRFNTLGRSTFDNRNIYSQVDYLAHVYQQTKIPQFKAAVLRGIDYILKEQRSTGGWRGRDVDAITFNDDVMVGVMRLLLKIRNGESQFDWLESSLKKELAQSLEKAIDATLKCQIVAKGRLTAWCQQHDHLTFQPVKARTFELPSITAQESVGIVRFLMELPNPSKNIVSAIDHAIVWFESAQILDLRIKQISIEPVRFEQFTAKFDRIAVRDDNAPPLWARFYEIDTNRPFFCNRDGKKVYRLADVTLERRIGYGWYGNWPSKLISREYPKWKKSLSQKDRP